MAKVYKKTFVEDSVYDLAKKRTAHIFDRFDKVVVSFSGGKDSTVCLNLAYEEAQRRGLDLDVMFWDEEAVQPETIDYVRRVANKPGINMKWLCLPVKHRNACSRKSPWWNPWHPDEESIWCRPLPPEALTEKDYPTWKRFYTIPTSNDLIYGPEHGSVGMIVGIRTDESISRYRGVATQLRDDNYIASAKSLPTGSDSNTVGSSQHIMTCKPIYDWSAEDVWIGIHSQGWDYNIAYNTMWKAGIGASAQRVAPPYGEEPLIGLWMYAVCWPELWEKMIHRVPGAGTAARYAKTELYGFGGHARKPEKMSWKEYVRHQLMKFNPNDRKKVAHRIRQLIDDHNNKTNFALLHETEPNEKTGMSWKFVAQVATRGDFKGRKVANTMAART